MGKCRDVGCATRANSQAGGMSGGPPPGGDGVPPGWYPDPYGPGWRWWNGIAWTEFTSPRSERSRWMGFGILAPVLAVLDALATVVSAGLIVAALVLLRPLPGVGALLVPAIPLLFGGQIWAIIIVNKRNRVRRSRLKGLRKLWASSTRFQDFFGPLPSRTVATIAGVFFLGWLSAMTAFPGLSQGGPSGASPECPYQLNNHGTYACVSKARYQQAGAAEQRLAAGVMLGFFSVHLGVAYSEVVRRRSEAPPPDEPQQ
jgi:hypothetical protein